MHSHQNKIGRSIAIVGCAGVPACYGGFETLAEQLVKYNEKHKNVEKLVVYCSSNLYQSKLKNFHGAQLKYIPINSNGPKSLIYDIFCILHAVFKRNDAIVLLGHGGSFIIPLMKFLSNAKFITNIDGIEWKRDKWSWFARLVLRHSERFAVRYSDNVIVDNLALQKYVMDRYKSSSVFIAYGGDHVFELAPDISAMDSLPQSFALGICRIEPENNIHLILEAFNICNKPLIFIGNWDNSEYGRDLKSRYKEHGSIIIHDPVYDLGRLRTIRQSASLYVHGHSAGGTNPSLVEMMHFGKPIVAFDCDFNRYTTNNEALYFSSSDDLVNIVSDFDSESIQATGPTMKNIALKHYTWENIGSRYFDTIMNCI